MDIAERIADWTGWSEADWRSIVLLETPLVEIFLRGSVMYLVLFALLRSVLKREAGGVAITDILVIVLLADAAQNAIADDYRSISDGILLVATIIFWNYALNWLGFRFPRIQALVHPRPLTLVEDGRPIHRNLKKELLTTEELMSLLRLQGVDDIRQVRRASMEGDGRISVLMAGENGAGTGRHQNERQPRI